MPGTSFRPLTRNRYRCSVTGKIIKKDKLDAHRRYLANKDRAQRAPTLSPFVALPIRVAYDPRTGAASCPDCRRLHYRVPGEKVACGCGATLLIYRRQINWD